jgi:protease IV
MSNFAFVSALIRGDWAIEEQFAHNSLELIERILEGTFPDMQVEPATPSFISSRASHAGKPERTTAQKVMVLPVSGVLMKGDGPCGAMGMATMANHIKAANRDPECAGVVLDIDSPGGTVDGTEMLSKVIKASGKPVVAFIDGMAASAALWIASAASNIIASSANDQVGSVGAMLRLMDTQGKAEKEGVRFHTIISDQTPDKNKYALEIQAGNYDGYKNDHLNPLAQNFIDAVTDNRPGIESSYLTGKMYFVKDAMGAFVDRVGSLDDAVASVLELASQSAHSKKNVIRMNQFKKINAVLSVDDLESVDGSISLNEDQMAAIETALGELPAIETAAVQEEFERVRADLVTSQTTLASVMTDLTARGARISELEAQVAELEGEPGAESAKLVKPTDGAPANHPMGLSQESVELFNRIKS